MSDQILEEAKKKMQSAAEHLHTEYSKFQTGRASTALVDSIQVESFGTMMPLKGLANISVPESNQIAIQPWNRDQLVYIEKAIRESNMGLNPSNDGIVIRLIIPPLTEERRRDLVKLVHKYAEEAKISIRNARHEGMAELKKLEIGEDELKGRERKLQEIVEELNEKVEEMARQKEKDLMTI